MNGEEYRIEMAFDARLQPGVKVVAHWTNSHRFFAVPAEVVKVNKKSLVVTLLEEVRGYWLKPDEVLYPAGQQIHLPRIADFKAWTAHNRAYPLAAIEPEGSAHV